MLSWKNKSVNKITNPNQEVIVNSRLRVFYTKLKQ
jgi:hypothetical protein